MPIPTEWTEALCVGVDALDDDMRILLGVLNQLGQAVAEDTAADVVASLVIFFCDYAQTHFRREENLLERLDYPALAPHRVCHQEFVRWIETFRGTPQENMPSQMLAFPAGWLIDHTLTAGQEMPGFPGRTGGRGGGRPGDGRFFCALRFRRPGERPLARGGRGRPGGGPADLLSNCINICY